MLLGGLSQLPVAELKQRLAALGVQVPAWAVEKNDLVKILRSAEAHGRRAQPGAASWLTAPVIPTAAPGSETRRPAASPEPERSRLPRHMASFSTASGKEVAEPSTLEDAQAQAEREVEHKQRVVASASARISEASLSVSSAQEALGTAAAERWRRTEAMSMSRSEFAEFNNAMRAEFQLLKDWISTFRMDSTSHGSWEEADDPKHFAVLQPLLRRVGGIEETMITAFSAAVAVPPSARGEFDCKVVAEISRGMSAHIAQLSSEMASSSHALSVQEAAVTTAESACSHADRSQVAAGQLLQAAEAELAGARSVLERLQAAARQVSARRRQGLDQNLPW
ncbi:unnamed protein product [Polarella glacialis]|uniref:Uncharacterized protein n=1 Tax=Polarella glacialis TaxID=89957 RepID=A0A813JE41_POLGL|nr:unnamed protein product [Polarella glacialis]